MKGDECKYEHPKEECQRFIETIICEDRKCKYRHRKLCRYFIKEIGCFRNEDCQYLHKQVRYERQKTQDKKDKTKENVKYKCNHCHFKCARKVNLNIHVKTKHESLLKMKR